MKGLNYCHICGKELNFKTLLDGSIEKYCSNCDHVFFDEPSPAVIVAVINNSKILLTRSIGWDHPYWGLVAGHVKSGETAEETAVREVNEEVGLDIKNLSILGTFASKDRDLLMIGFKAYSENTSIKKSQELEKAEWFRLNDHLPVRPCSIASQIASKITSKL
jgi:NAD+ diphosphatase